MKLDSDRNVARSHIKYIVITEPMGKMHIVYIMMMVSTNRTTKTMSVYFKEAVKTHKIYKRENAQSFLLQGRFLSQRINHSGFISLWPQDILWAATVQDITCQLCNINSLDGPENRHCGLWSGAVVMCNMQKDEWTVPRMALWKSHAKGFLVRIS